MGIPWKIYRAPQPPTEIGVDNGAHMDPLLKEIVILDSSPADMLHLLMHEVIHVLDGCLTLRLNETTIRRLGHALTEMLLANGLVSTDLLDEKFWRGLPEKK
jgi:hypothetical protein